MNHALKIIFIFTNDNVCVIIGITTEYYYISKRNYMEHSTVLLDNTSLFNIVSQRVFLLVIRIKYISNHLRTCMIHFWKFFYQLRNILFIQTLDNAQILRNCNIKNYIDYQHSTTRYSEMKNTEIT